MEETRGFRVGFGRVGLPLLRMDHQNQEPRSAHELHDEVTGARMSPRT